ncbi:MAG: hypothetical protein CMP10_01470 [Zetaproteobacteria bacterium]|nr:hypothetical protein [Pseudobdellovibrionaceae bacterium]
MTPMSDRKFLGYTGARLKISFIDGAISTLLIKHLCLLARSKDAELNLQLILSNYNNKLY